MAHLLVRFLEVRASRYNPSVTFELVTAPSGGYLQAVRSVLKEADDALICVAFAQARGVHLLADELSSVAQRGSARVVVTTSLGTSTAAALTAIADCRADVRILNPGGGTYHPKAFLGRRGPDVRAVVGSANLTSGLVANVEAGTMLAGPLDDPELARLWAWAENIWGDPRTEAWRPSKQPPRDEQLEPELLQLLLRAKQADPVVYTLGSRPRPNYVRDVNATGIWVETQRSRALQDRAGRAAAQFVTPRMLNLAWDTLKARGRLSNREILKELRIHRSSFVCAMLTRLPGVTREPGSEIVLRYSSPL
jgi:hypothetical protein